jgi:hypothetical protein
MCPERTYIGWLGRQDSNLGMAESKSKWFALFVNACSEKTRKYDLNPFKRLADISEYRDALGLSVRGALASWRSLDDDRFRETGMFGTGRLLVDSLLRLGEQG